MHNQSSIGRWRRWGAMVALWPVVLWSLWMVFSSWANVSAEQHGPDAVAIEQFASRMEPAMERLQTIATMRYVSSAIPSSKQADLSRRPMMAYILAPIALSEQSDSHVVLADFPSDRELAEHFRGQKIILWAHLAPGLAILEMRGLGTDF